MGFRLLTASTLILLVAAATPTLAATKHPAKKPAAATAPAGPAGDPVNGAAIFKQRCGICHQVTEAITPGPAPNMRGLVGRKAASQAGFNYSPALKNSGLTWTPANIDKFITAPQVMVPGTFMVVMVPDPKERADVISYFATLKK